MRLEKEIARSEASTAAVGGITKAGNALEELLRTVVITLELDTQQRARGMGDYLTTIKQSRQAPSGDALLDEIAREARKSNNRLNAMLLLRNRNDHPGAVDVRAAKDTMNTLARWLHGLLDRQ